LGFLRKWGELCAHQSFKILRRCAHRGRNSGFLGLKTQPQKAKVKAEAADQPSEPSSDSSRVLKPASGASEAASGRFSGGSCRGE